MRWILAWVLAVGLLSAPARADMAFSDLIDRAVAQRQAGDLAGFAATLGAAISAYDAQGMQNLQLLSDAFYFKAAAERRTGDSMAALQTLDMAEGRTPPLIQRLPEMAMLRGEIYIDLNLYAQAAALFDTAATHIALLDGTGRFRPTEPAELRVLATFARARAGFTVAPPQLDRMRSDVDQIGAASGGTYHTGQLLLLQVDEFAGRVREAREGYLNLAAEADPVTAASALKSAALIDMQLGRRDLAVRAARDALALEALQPEPALVLEALIALASDPGAAAGQVKDWQRRLDGSGGALPVKLRAAVELMLLASQAMLAEPEAASGLDPSEVDLSYLGQDAFPEDAYLRRRVFDIRLTLAELFDAAGHVEAARDIFQPIWLDPGAADTQRARAVAGLARTGIAQDGHITDNLRFGAGMAEQAARYAMHQLASLPARQAPGFRQQVARLAATLEQSVDLAFDALASDPPIGPCDTQISCDQTGPFFFPWEPEPGYVGLSQGGTYPDLLERTFAQMQTARHSEAGQAIAAMTARLAAGDDALGVLLRARDGLIAARALAARGGAATRAEVLRLDAEITRAETRLAQDFPAYARQAAPPGLSLADARGLLAAGEALVVSLATGRGLHTLALDARGVTWHRAALPRADLRAKVAALRAGLDPTAATRAAAALDDTDGAAEADAPFDRDLAHDLYEAALGPVLRHLAPGATLLVVPDDALQTLPFGVLIRAPTPPDAPWAAVPWAIRDNAFATLPTPGSLRALRRDAQPSRGTLPFLGVGDPVFDAARQRVALAPLPETAGELRLLRDKFGGGTLRLGTDATRAALHPEELAEARVIAFATHGLLGGEAPGLTEPALALTPDGPEDRGLLTASAISEMQLDADWVILSACNTGAGPDAASAEGLSGLARAFFYAGARRVLVSHWPVQSDATVALTTGLGTALADDTGPEALRRAMLAMIDDPLAPPDWGDPAVWGPFVVAGG